MNLTDKQIAKWAKIRDGGLWRFVLLRGALAWGLFVAAPVLVVISLFSRLPGFWFVLVAWLFCSVVGALFFYWHWHRMEVYLERQIKISAGK